MWEVITTKDGSQTLFSPSLNESYHSKFGAVQESQHVFIKNGFNLIKEKPQIRIFEMGFGTGLNVLLTLNSSDGLRQIEYHSIEAAPVEKEILCEIDHKHNQTIFAQLHQCPWNERQAIRQKFFLTKIKDNFLTFDFKETYDLIYYDAFAPDVQPELWDKNAMDIIAKIAHQGTVFVTYCAKGNVRRGLEAAGFKMERLEGPPGKREMLRGIKQ